MREYIRKKWSYIACSIKPLLLIILAAAVIYVSIWLLFRESVLDEYGDGLDRYDWSGYSCMDDEGYSYSLKLPDGLRFTCNLCVTSPDGNVSLFIWPGIAGEKEYGIQINDDEGLSCICIDEREKSLNGGEEVPGVMVQELLDRAAGKWKL